MSFNLRSQALTLTYVFKFENLHGTGLLPLILYDAAGKPLIDQTFSGEGSQQGSIGYESAGHAANPVAAQNAIKQAVSKAVDAISTAIAANNVEHASAEQRLTKTR
jgi:hypothetical protein